MLQLPYLNKMCDCKSFAVENKWTNVYPYKIILFTGNQDFIFRCLHEKKNFFLFLKVLTSSLNRVWYVLSMYSFSLWQLARLFSFIDWVSAVLSILWFSNLSNLVSHWTQLSLLLFECVSANLWEFLYSSFLCTYCFCGVSSSPFMRIYLNTILF